MNKKNTVVISFSQSKKYPTDWKVRYEYKDGFRDIFTLDEINKRTKFGENPDKELMKVYAEGEAVILATAMGCELEVIFK